ncbi:MAG: hypothetical protein HYW79_00855 [Parcubacteria group bacterium]|nr:hypothetical protein [Parcubacteria group bacterium]
MPELTREEKIKLFEKLPKELQDLMESENTGAFLLYLGEKYNLDEDKISLLSKIVGNVILKITPITSLAQEIVNKVIPDSQIAMAISQELNSGLLTPVLMQAPTAPPAITATPRPVLPTAPALQPIPSPAVPSAKIVSPAVPKIDQYREPTTAGPEIIDLRKAPPSPLHSFPRPSEALREGGSEGELPPGLPVAAAPILLEADPHLPEKISPAPPVQIPSTKYQIPLTDTYRESIPPATAPAAPLMPATNAEPKEPPVAGKVEPPVVSKVEPPPQYIIRPPGLPPIPTPQVGTPTSPQANVGADSYRDVLDLRKDKGEF